jgi:STE24 endopeptidase
MFAVIWLISLPVSVFFDIIDTFKIEAKYGFNKTTAKTFILDFIKETLLMNVVVLMGLLSLFMFLHNAFGNAVFVAFIFVMAAFMLFMVLLSPLLLRVFNKLTLLEDGALKDRATALCEAIGYPAKRIFVMDTSKRTTKANAGFSGFGKKRVMVLSDNLIEKFTEDEVISVIAHEIAHSKKRHIFRQTPLRFLSFALILGIAYFVVNSEAMSQAFGFDEINAAFGLFITMAIASPVFILLSVPMQSLSRKHEYEADVFSVRYAGKEAAVSAMKKIGRVNYANLTPHPFVVKLTYSHPTLSQRIGAMEVAEGEAL